ncbi:MAG: phosphohistidine phosphatase SixA [Pseudohongiellaceae bacterium]
MIVYLMRHGEAENYAVSDAARRLTQKGIEDCQVVVAQLKAKLPPIDRVITSPFQRAVETSAIVSANMSVPEFEVSRRLQPESDVLELLKFIDQSNAGHLLLVAHNPLLSLLVALMVDGVVQGTRALGTSHLMGVSMEVVAPGCGELLFTLTP